MTLRLRTLCWLRTGDETRFSFPACNVPGPPRPRPSARKPTLSTSRDRPPRATPVSRSLRAVDSGWIQLGVLLSGPQGDRRSCSHQALRLGLGSHARSLVFAVRWASSQGLSCSRRLGTRQVQAASGWPPESRGLEVQAQKSHLKPPSTSLSERRPPTPRFVSEGTTGARPSGLRSATGTVCGLSFPCLVALRASAVNVCNFVKLPGAGFSSTAEVDFLQPRFAPRLPLMGSPVLNYTPPPPVCVSSLSSWLLTLSRDTFLRSVFDFTAFLCSHIEPAFTRAH